MYFKGMAEFNVTTKYLFNHQLSVQKFDMKFYAHKKYFISIVILCTYWFILLVLFVLFLAIQLFIFYFLLPLLYIYKCIAP